MTEESTKIEENTKMICISCPKGCTLDVTHDGKTIVNIIGATCKQGQDFVEKELTDPRRMVATTVRVKSGMHPLVPVYTKMPFPKPRIYELLAELRKVEMQAPVEINQVILENPLGEGIDVVASRSMPKV